MIGRVDEVGDLGVGWEGEEEGKEGMGEWGGKESHSAATPRRLLACQCPVSQRACREVPAA
jgi:hypothetical protein